MSGQNEMYRICFSSWTTDLHRVKQHTGQLTKALFIHIRTTPWQEIIFDPLAFQLFHKMILALSYSHLNTPSLKVFGVCLYDWWMGKLRRCYFHVQALINTFCSIWMNGWNSLQMCTTTLLFDCYLLAQLFSWWRLKMKVVLWKE